GAAVCRGAASAAMPVGVSQYLNLAGSKICAALIWGAETLSRGGFVARVKIEPHCAFLIECALIAGLIFMPKISGGKKFLLPPLTAILGILLSAL
ncbi:MAG: hypothetical protein J6P03_02520, partial [Opitutales bacterium]|nr:hypothetical protein [Opitutales bacterium]